MPINHDSIASEVDDAKRAGGSTDGDSRPLSAAIDSVRLEVERLDAIRELLEYADHDLSEQKLRLEADWRAKRQRLIRSITRIRARRLADRQAAVGASPAATSTVDESEHQALRAQLAETLAMLESTRDALRDAEAERNRSAQERSEEAQRHTKELERLRQECKSLRDELSAVAAPPAAAASSPTAEMSWEQRKAAVLEQLRREDGECPYTAGEKASMHEMIAKSDSEIRRRDEEIAELRQMLDQQSTTLGTAGVGADGEPLAVGAAAFGHLFDADEMIREEREKLKEIRQQWEEKLRQSEIELSLERAKLARGRRELEQKQADLEEQLFRLSKDQGNAAESGSHGTQQPQRRWLRQLGLGEGG